jgi:hypothetical protein
MAALRLNLEHLCAGDKYNLIQELVISKIDEYWR